MLVVHVFIHVKSDVIEAFKTATLNNVHHSNQESGIARFELIEQQDDPARFVLIEIYHTPEAAAAHKETSHYTQWRDTVADMMQEPRSSIKYNHVSPCYDGWML